ncbi:Protein piccolo [Labeo rohita]|uniref:Protein piccolo n=1 Tax=Labeo rohita TaxID=84645 RepID=A0ABQ8LWS7_LABRO|nr:Protein piccolo [Labeo rohita]
MFATEYLVRCVWGGAGHGQRRKGGGTDLEIADRPCLSDYIVFNKSSHLDLSRFSRVLLQNTSPPKDPAAFGHRSTMNPASRLLCLRQGIFCNGLKDNLYNLMPDNRCSATPEQYIDFALLLAGSPFTVGIANEEPCNPPVSPNFSVMSGIVSIMSEPSHAKPAKPKPVHVMPAKPKPAQVISTKPRPAHITSAAPGPVHITSARPQPAHAMPAAPDPRNALNLLPDADPTVIRKLDPNPAGKTEARLHPVGTYYTANC